MSRPLQLDRRTLIGSLLCLFRAAMLSAIAAFFLALSTINAVGQAAVFVAPKPTQLASAKAVFIANNTIGGGEGSDFLYSHFYEAVQKLNRFSIVLAPQDADLILEYSIADIVGQNNPGHVHSLRILDPKTRFVLWSVSEYEAGASRQSSVEKNLQEALSHLAADLQRVTSTTK